MWCRIIEQIAHKLNPLLPNLKAWVKGLLVLVFYMPSPELIPLACSSARTFINQLRRWDLRSFDELLDWGFQTRTIYTLKSCKTLPILNKTKTKQDLSLLNQNQTKQCTVSSSVHVVYRWDLGSPCRKEEKRARWPRNQKRPWHPQPLQSRTWKVMVQYYYERGCIRSG